MKRVSGLIFLLLITATFVAAGEIIQTITFSPNELVMGTDKGYDFIRYGINPNYDDVVGYPALPELPLYIVVPPSATVTGVEVLSADERTIQGEYLVMPAQNTRPFSVMEEPAFVEPNPEIYNSKSIWPEAIVDYHSTGTKSGFRVGSFRMYPVRYLPSERKLVFCANLKLRITYQENAVEPMRRTERQIALHTSDLMGIVANYQDIKRFAPMVRQGNFASPFLPAGNYEHVILTPTAYKDTFQIMANWRTKNGIPSRVFCIESTSVYPGRDVAEKMRNFLRDADTTWGLNFVFIGRADHHLTPGTNRQYRNCWAYLYGSYRDTLPCDYYFGDLWRGKPPGVSYVPYDWNSDRDGIFGEANDSIDFWFDIYPGMITIDNAAQASHWLKKFLRHESSADSMYFTKSILLNAVTFSDSFNNRIAEQTPTPPWFDLKAYQSGAGAIRPSAALLRDSVNRGYGYTAIIAHGLVNSIGVPDNYTASHVNGQTNTHTLNTLIAVCCHPGAFDQADECLAETMAVADRGYINIMMNSRYGWVCVAELYNTLFFCKFLPYDNVPPQYSCSNYVYVGQALARVKEHLMYKYPRPGASNDSSRWRWESYEKNLFGDPAGMCHNARPVRTMGVTHPNTIRIGSQNFTVSVNVTDFAPVESVLVTLWKGTEVYARGYTNASGSVTLPINPTTVGQMSVTANKRNYNQYESMVSVTSFVAEENAPVVPAYFALGRSEPNPFGRITTISYQLPKPVHSRLVIYDASGRLIRTLVDRNDKAGWYTVNWDGKNSNGVECAAGIYFYRLEAGSFTATKNLVLVR